jgi:hypothetical protein
LFDFSTRKTLMPHVDADAFAFLPNLLDRVLVEQRQKTRQNFENGDLGASPRIDMAELERDHAPAHEQHASRLLATAQHFVRGDHQLGALDGQRPRA